MSGLYCECGATVRFELLAPDSGRIRIECPMCGAAYDVAMKSHKFASAIRIRRGNKDFNPLAAR